MRGLHTYASDLSGVPSGSLAVALNININRQGIAEPRRGFDVLTYPLPLEADRARKLVFWNSETFVHYGTTFAYYNPASGVSSRGTVSAPTFATSIRTVSSQNKNLYVTTSAGLKKTDAVATSLYSAGVPKGLTIDLALTGAGTAVANTKFVTYRYLLARKDANSNTTFGDVSGRFTIQNAAGSTQNLSARCHIPAGLDATYYLELYRSPDTATSETSDDLQKCYEVPVTATDITNKYVDISDILPEALLGGYIYTSPNAGAGLVSGNALPPLARDVAEYKGSLFFADLDGPQRLTFNLISCGGTGVVASDTITLVLGATTEVYTAHGTTFNAASKQFVVTTGGSSSQNIDDTVKSFIKCVNLASTVAYAYSLSESNTDLPGKALLETRDVGTATFTLVSTRAAAFQPQLTATATINNTSAAESLKHGIAFSKQNQPEAVPLKNRFFVGSSDDRIKRIVALRDGLFIFKERDGCYVLRGDSEATFSVTLLDNTAKLLAPDTIQVVNNLIYGLFEAGLCEVSDTGVSIISTPIKDKILPLFGAPLAVVKALAFGIANDTDGKYLLCVPETSADTYCTQQIVFDTFGRNFSEWDLALSCGGVNPVDTKTYLGSGDANTVKSERKLFDYTDYADYGSACTVTSYSGTTVYINNTSGMTAGDLLMQGVTAFAYIETVVATGGYVVIDVAQTWTLATADVVHERAVNCQVQWNPDYGGNAALLKQYYECNLLLKQAFQKEASIVFSSDVNPSEASIAIASASGNGSFGQFDFGDEVWGGEQARTPVRVGIPRGHARCNQLSVRVSSRVAYSDFQLAGLSLTFNPTSTRTAR